MNCDRLSQCYRWLEYLAFGRELERRRSAFLDQMRQARRALIIGDGDGRFTSALAKSNSEIEIDSIDLSRNMLDVSRRRLERINVRNPDRVRFVLGDVRSVDLPNRNYDLVVTHFIFDFFAESDLADVVHRVAHAVTDECLWAVSEFEIPQEGWRRVYAALYVRAMYLFFRLVIGLENQSLPDWRRALGGEGFACAHKQAVRGGLIISELWQCQKACSVVRHSTADACTMKAGRHPMSVGGNHG